MVQALASPQTKATAQMLRNIFASRATIAGVRNGAAPPKFLGYQLRRRSPRHGLRLARRHALVCRHDQPAATVHRLHVGRPQSDVDQNILGQTRPEVVES
jgi:hypothetical protein